MNKIKGRNKIKTNKGITLIALVITIIVLLILATISIATLTGENGILNKADNAKIEEEKSSAKEKVQIAVMGSFGNDGNISKSELKTNLDKVEGIKKPIPDIIKLPTTVKVDGYEVTINEDGKVTLGEVLYFVSYVVIEPGNAPLEKKQTLSDKEYRAYYEKYGNTFKVGMGAEAIKEF